MTDIQKDLSKVEAALKKWRNHCQRHRFGGFADDYKDSLEALDAWGRCEAVGLDLPLMTVGRVRE